MSNSMLSDNLKALMARYNLSETELSRRTQVGQPVIHRMASGETDNPKVGTLSPIANLFGLSINELMGFEPMPAGLQQSLPTDVLQGWHHIRALTPEQALQLPDVLAHPNDTGNAFTDVAQSDNAFAIALRDDAMAPQFPKGTLVVFDPNLEAVDQDFVLVEIENAPAAIFRQLMCVGDERYLKPLSPDLKPLFLDKPYTIIGVMVQARVNFA